MVLPLIDDLSSFIGVPALTDFSPVVNPFTDIGSAGYNNCFADTAMMTHTLTRCYATFSLGVTPALVEHDAVWGKTIAVAPTIVHNSTGDYTVTWPVSVVNALGTSVPLNLRRALAGNIESTSLFFNVCNLTAPNKLHFRIYTSAGALSNATSADLITVVVL